MCIRDSCYSLYKAVESVYGTPECFAGYSQGEFCACAAAGMFEIPDALKLILNLERLLLKTSAEAESMVRVIDLDIEILKVICREIDPSGKKLCVSAYISNNQNIVSGKKDELKKLRAAAKNNGARWVLNLDSKRAYHSSLCSDAAQSAKKYFDSISLSKPGRYIYLSLIHILSSIKKLFSETEVADKNIPVFFGSSFSSLKSLHDFNMVYEKKGALSVNPGLFPNTVLNSPSCRASIYHKITQPIYNICLLYTSYKTSVYTSDKINDMYKRLLFIADQIFENPGIQIKNLKLTDSNEYQKYIYDFNKTLVNNVKYETWLECFY